MSEITLQGIATARGVAIGKAFRYTPVELTIPHREAGSPHEEMARFEAACKQASQEIADISEKVPAETAAIFKAHQMMLEDPLLINGVQARLTKGQPVEKAVQETIEELAEMFRSMDNEMFAARAVDILDVGHRILRILLGVQEQSLEELQQPSIIVAHDITPSDTLRLNLELVLGFCTASGGVTSHTAIIARALGIPAVVGLGKAALEQIPGGVKLAIDGGRGIVVVQPSASTINRLKKAQQKQTVRLAALVKDAKKNARTANGRRVEVSANVGDLDTAKEAVRFGAEGVGLLRTEFLYLQSSCPPSEEEQIAAYRAIFESMQGRPVIIRTLDIGGDKPPPYIDFGDEPNPFLGWRAIRFCLDNIPLFKTHLRAILQAAVDHNVKLMYPMISGVADLEKANRVLDEVSAELESEGATYARQISTGIMIETPSAVVMADALAAMCDFFSLGTNDLAQYTLAVDRTNERVAHLYHPLDPAILRLIKQTIDTAHAQGIWVGMCGELAGIKEAIPILLGFGLDEFSMAPPLIPEAKWLISLLSDQQAKEIAAQALTFHTATEVSDYMQKVLLELGVE
jgi:phosphotransferase system enzyme I (PtsI)